MGEVRRKSICILDSGIGGLSVAAVLWNWGVEEKKALRISYKADYEFYPYGLKSADQIKQRVLNIICSETKKLRSLSTCLQHGKYPRLNGSKRFAPRQSRECGRSGAAS